MWLTNCEKNRTKLPEGNLQRSSYSLLKDKTWLEDVAFPKSMVAPPLTYGNANRYLTYVRHYPPYYFNKKIRQCLQKMEILREPWFSVLLFNICELNANMEAAYHFLLSGNQVPSILQIGNFQEK